MPSSSPASSRPAGPPIPGPAGPATATDAALASYIRADG